jgi:hypothetical protein
MLEELDRLVALHKSGALTDAEFGAAKEQLLSSQPPARTWRNRIPPFKSARTLVAAAVVLLLAGGATAYALHSASTAAGAGTTMAAQACTEALTKQTAMADANIVAHDKAVADKAAAAAVSNAKWNDLAKATSDWALTRQDLVTATTQLQAGVDITAQLQQINTRVDDARRGLIAACRVVKASGGQVDEALLNSL